jgi:predicted ATPase
VPDNLQQLIDMQFDGLGAEEQQVLAAASVAGVEFSAAGVAAGLAQEVEPVDDWCTALTRRGQFLQTSGEQRWPDGTVAGAYRFVHALYQQVLYHRVSAAQRVRLHQRIGARLEAGHGAQVGDIAAELAMHFARGGDAHRAVQYLRQAGQRSVSVRRMWKQWDTSPERSRCSRPCPPRRSAPGKNSSCTLPSVRHCRCRKGS